MSALFAGKISDISPRVKLLICVCIMWNLTSFINMIAKTYGMIAAMRMMFGLFSAFCSTTCYSLISDLFPPAKRTLANAIFTTGSFIGIALSSLANNLIGSLGWRGTYGVCGIYGLCSVCFLILFVKEPQRGRYEAKKEEII